MKIVSLEGYEYEIHHHDDGTCTILISRIGHKRPEPEDYTILVGDLPNYETN